MAVRTAVGGSGLAEADEKSCCDEEEAVLDLLLATEKRKLMALPRKESWAAATLEKRADETADQVGNAGEDGMMWPAQPGAASC